jgi:hypothetical protein
LLLNAEAVQVLVDCGADVNAADQGGFTPLQSLVLCMQEQWQDAEDEETRDRLEGVLQILLKLGARLDMATPRTPTPLDLLLAWGESEDHQVHHNARRVAWLIGEHLRVLDASAETEAEREYVREMEAKLPWF